ENKTKTGELVQQYIEGALNWAIAKHYIAGNNAASLKGPLQFLLPKVKAFYVTKHHDALPWQEAGQFMAQLRACADNTGRIEAGSRSAPGQATPRCKVCAHPDRLAIEAARRGGASRSSRRSARAGTNLIGTRDCGAARGSGPRRASRASAIT